MEEIKLKRGGVEVTFKKLPEYFAVRLRQGKASDEMALEASCGRPKTELKHVDRVDVEKMDIFAVKESAKLEETMGELRKAPASDVITHMYAMDETPGGGVIPTGTMTIQFKPEVEGNEQEKILAEFGLEVLEDLDFLPHGYTVQLTEASKINPLKIARELQKRDEIETAEPDLNFRVSFKHVPTDTLYPKQWHLKNRGDKVGLVAGADVKAEAAWECTRGSREITVCVMDDGFDLEHPDFKALGKIVAPRDFGQGPNDFDPSPVHECDNHGTACAGVAIAEENGVGVVGLAPKCAFMPVRLSDRINDQTIVNMFQYAIDKHADVISCSWGVTELFFPLSTKMERIIHKAATEGRRNKKGCVILFAAGNDNCPLSGSDEHCHRISHQGFALHPDVITVAASNSQDKRSEYSNHGPQLEICAPSSGSPGRGIVTTDRRGGKGYSSGDYTFDFGGTSSATPLAAGLAALILSVDPELTSKEVKDIMMDTADKIDAESGQYVDGHSVWYGHGRINAHKALASIEGLPAVLYMEHRINKPIPDKGEVEDSITFPMDVAIKDVEISLDIQHAWRGDLRVILTPPQGDEIILVNRTGGSQGDIIQSFRSSDEPELFASLIGKSGKGNWRLKVLDMAKQDVGLIRKWGLTVAYT